MFEGFEIKQLLIFILLLVPALLQAEIYKTVDESGRVIFTDKPTINAEQVEVDTSQNNTDGLSSSQYSKADKIKQSPRQKPVVMYSTNWCGVCTKARQYMQSNGIRFKEYDIEKSDSAHREFKKLGGKGVPLILVGNQKMSGFSASRLTAMLGNSK